jgi:hypothetical protein
VVLPTLLGPEVLGFKLSPGTVDGGVSRFPTLMFAGPGWLLEMGGYFPWKTCSGGGGSSKLGRFDAADLRAVKLGGAPIGSMFGPMPGCCITAVMLYGPWRPCSDGLTGSLSAPGGVGRVVGGMLVDGAAAPGQ